MKERYWFLLAIILTSLIPINFIFIPFAGIVILIAGYKFWNRIVDWNKPF